MSASFFETFMCFALLQIWWRIGAALGACCLTVALTSLSLAAENEACVDSLTDGRFVREHWAEFGMENANPMSNRRFRVNAPEVVLHKEFGSRSETKSSG